MNDIEARALLEKYHTPLHVRRHCEAVAAFATELGNKLVKAGVAVNVELVRVSALLHDIVRVVDFREFNPEKFSDPGTPEDIAFWKKLRAEYAGQHHAKAGADILKKEGYPEIAQIVGKHGFLQIEKGFDSWEEKLLYYADKRVKHDKVVSLKERLEDGRKRNAPETTSLEHTAKLDEKVYALEQEILTHL